jgi:hypothetical protein
MHFDVRDFVDAQHAVVVEVRLTHAALVDGDLAPERCGKAENQAALQLRHDGIGIDRDAGVDGRCHAAQMNLAVIVHFGLNHGGDEAAEGRLHTHAPTGARRQRLAPAGFFRDQIERGFQASTCPPSWMQIRANGRPH